MTITSAPEEEIDVSRGNFSAHEAAKMILESADTPSTGRTSGFFGMPLKMPSQESNGSDESFGSALTSRFKVDTSPRKDERTNGTMLADGIASSSKSGSRPSSKNFGKKPPIALPQTSVPEALLAMIKAKIEEDKVRVEYDLAALESHGLLRISSNDSAGQGWDFTYRSGPASSSNSRRGSIRSATLAPLHVSCLKSFE